MPVSLASMAWLVLIGLTLLAAREPVAPESAAGDNVRSHKVEVTGSNPMPPRPRDRSGEPEPDEPLARGIRGSPHDFSDGGRVPRDLCTPCHTPHLTAAQAPLLVRRPGAADTVRAYESRAGRLDAASLVCLSCHDGVVATDVYAGAHAMSWSERVAAGLAPGASRVTNHPVGVLYPEGRSDYHAASAVTASGRIRLPEGRIQCTTCHDPHNTERIPGMLVMSNERSRLCLACHRL